MAFTNAESAMGPSVSVKADLVTAPESKLRGRLARIWNSWATRSLAVGAVATVLDLAIGLTLRNLLHVETRIAAMSGVIIGSTFTYFANRYFAFRDENPALASSMLKFVLATVISSLVHGQFVVWLTDRLGVPFALSKVLADLAIFSVGQLLVLRYLVFPKVAAKPLVASSTTLASDVS